MTSLYIAALFLGIVTGLRCLTPFAVLSWAAVTKSLVVAGTWAGFMGFLVTAIIATVLAVGELVADKLPKTPSRKEIPGLGARLVLGGFYGAIVGTVAHGLVMGLLLGVLGAVIGTYGGAWARAKAAEAFGRDLPAALIEDAITIAAAIAIVFGVV